MLISAILVLCFDRQPIIHPRKIAQRDARHKELIIGDKPTQDRPRHKLIVIIHPHRIEWAFAYAAVKPDRSSEKKSERFSHNAGPTIFNCVA